MDDFDIKDFHKGVQPKAHVRATRGGGQKVLKISPHGLWTTPYNNFGSCIMVGIVPISDITANFQLRAEGVIVIRKAKFKVVLHFFKYF